MALSVATLEAGIPTIRQRLHTQTLRFWICIDKLDNSHIHAKLARTEYRKSFSSPLRKAARLLRKLQAKQAAKIPAAGYDPLSPRVTAVQPMSTSYGGHCSAYGISTKSIVSCVTRSTSQLTTGNRVPGSRLEQSAIGNSPHFLANSGTTSSKVFQQLSLPPIRRPLSERMAT